MVILGNENNWIMKIKKYIYCVLLLFLFVSCHSNLIYFDIKNQSVVSCDGRILNLYIISKDGNDYLCFSLLPEKRGDNVFSVKKISENYSVRVIRTHINLQNFKLRPDMEYEIINNSIGDAANGRLLIKTDKNSNVIYADKISCD